MVSIHYFHSLLSLIPQTSIVHPLCARHFRDTMRIKLALTSKKANVQEMTHTHSELSLWYTLDMKGIAYSSVVKNLPVMQETWVQFLGGEDLMEKEMATHSNSLA